MAVKVLEPQWPAFNGLGLQGNMRGRSSNVWRRWSKSTLKLWDIPTKDIKKEFMQY